MLDERFPIRYWSRLWATILTLWWIAFLGPLLILFRLLVACSVPIYKLRAWILKTDYPLRNFPVKKWLAASGAALLLMIFAFVLAFRSLNSPVSETRGLTTFKIDRGANLTSISSDLKQEGLIWNATFFRMLARVKGFEGKVRAGAHEINRTWTSGEVLEELLKGGIMLQRVTIQEGLRISDIAQRLARSLPAVTAAEVESLSVNRGFIDSLGISANSLEGYLFPDTYEFGETMNARQIMRRMTERFQFVMDDSAMFLVDSLEMSLHEVVTLASIVEKEAQAAIERPIISQVFHSRLKKGMRLGSDPTVRFAATLSHNRAWLSSRDIDIDSPYNTYRYAGLPPGPICGPGKAALMASLKPANTDYLYFVANWDGTHTFTRSLRQHNIAKAKSWRIYHQMRRTQRAAARRKQG